MATISHLPFSLSFPSLHYRKPLFYSHQQPLLFVSYLNSTKIRGCFSCSIKKTRIRKRVKSNEDLRSEIMEFVALTGLPQGHVPSMKELAAHGRVDLANIVRRRGYKFIRELLANSDPEDSIELVVSDNNTDMEDFLSEGQGHETQDEHLSTATDHCISLDQEKNNFPNEGLIRNSSPEAEEHGNVCNDESSLAGVSSMENSLFNLDDSCHSGEITENNLKIEVVELNDRANIGKSSSEASISANHSLVFDDASNFPDREANNVLMTEDGDVNEVDKDHYTSQDLNYTKDADIATGSLSTESFQNLQIDDMAENLPGNADDKLVGSDGKNWLLGLSSSTSSIEEKTSRFIQNGYLDTVNDDDNDIPNESCPKETKESAETTKGGEYIEDSYSGQSSVRRPPNGSALALEEISHATEVNNSDRRSDQRNESADLENAHDEAMRQENQVEITRLRFMLRQKELELSRLKEQIEKEKLSLSVLQRQAETEIEKAQMLISDKDVELQEVEASLSGLQEVEIEYCGDGNVVEVTGSFNGWQHRVGLELKSMGKEKWWSTLLWLYPGTYEIKFIVDEEWTTDPKREWVTRGHITNNILKVER